MRKVTIYTTPWCGFCHRAKSLLRQHGVEFEDVDVDGDVERRAWLRQVTGQRTVPQIFFDDEPIGGCTDLEALIRAGRLDEKLGRAGPEGRP